jgi:hypothetical protein
MDGNYTAEFESWLAKKNGVKYAATCHSGTHALEIIAEYYASQKFWPNPPRVLSSGHDLSGHHQRFHACGLGRCDCGHRLLTDSWICARLIANMSVQAMVAVGSVWTCAQQA